MYPFLFGVEFLDLFIIMIVIGVIAALLLFKYNSKKLQMADKPYNFYATLTVISIVIGFVCSFALQQLYKAFDYLINKTPYEAGGITFYGGLIGAVVTIILGTIIKGDIEIKKDFWKFANMAVPSILLGHMFGRLGCCFAGCCYGKVTVSPLGMWYETLADYGFTHGTKVFPTQLFEAIFLLLMFIASMIMIYKFKKLNIQILFYGYAYSIFRFLIEFLRGDSRGELIPGLSPSQWQSIIIFGVITALTILIYKFKKVPFQKSIDKWNEFKINV